jgi:CRISPR-associated protein Csb2
VPGLLLRFPAGRYHATPLGYHVNEGQVEWPPSPWRILRALVASGFTTQHWKVIPESAACLIEKLAGTMPSYFLPTASAAHSRHFMPVGVLEKGREKTTLVFDTWLDIGDSTLEVHWACELTQAEIEQLRNLAESLGYLGRSESWVEAKVVENSAPSMARLNAIPHGEGTRRGPGWEQISLTAPVPPSEYAAWRSEAAERLLAGLALPEGKKKPTAKLLKDREKAVAPYPSTLIECLTKDTAWWKGHGWSQPPGAQRVLYWRPEDAIQTGALANPRVVTVRPVTAMLLAVTTPSGNRSALPARTRTLPQAELLHRALVSVLGKGLAVDCPEITGRDRQGRPLRGSHIHAQILPLDLDEDRRVDHFLIHAPMGLGDAAQRAIRGLRRTWTKGSASDLQLAIAGSGDLDTLRALPTPLDSKMEQVLGPPGGARIWSSLTPFVPPRFLKQRGANTLEGQIQAELASRGLPRAEEVSVLQGTAESAALRHFVRRRQRGGGPPPVDVGYALRLRFAAPVCGTLSLGYAAHFGLGLFAAETPADEYGSPFWNKPRLS